MLPLAARSGEHFPYERAEESDGMAQDWFDEGGTGSLVDVAAMFDSDASEAVWGIVQNGALLSLGLTSDGGALGVTVTVDGRWRREYFRQPEDLVAWLMGALPAVISARESLAASSAPRKRARSTRGL